jgi:hypothetical protein
MFRLLKALPLMLALAALSIFTTSCSSTNQAQVRVVHAISDGPALDIEVNTTKVFTNIAFTNVQPTPPAYTKVASGSVTLEAVDTGTTTAVIGNTTASLSGSSQYTVVMAGFLNGTGATAPTFYSIKDNNTAPTSGNVEFRIIDASPSSPGTVDVYIVPPGTNITSVTPQISALAYTQASTYQSLAAGTYSVIVTTSGSKNEFISQDFALPTAGMIRTLVLVDNTGGGLPASWLELSDLN